MYSFAVLTIFPAAVIFAAIYDLMSYRIPNKLSLFLLAGFFALAPFAGMSLETFGGHLLAGGIVLAVTFAMFAVRIIGGGDAKLISAIALWMGTPLLLEYMLVASLAGGALALGLILFRTLPLPAPLLREGWLVKLHTPKADLPYGVALAAAGIYLYPHTIWVRSLAV